MSSVVAGPQAGALLAPRLQTFLSEGNFCDCVLTVGEERLRAHQVVLAAQNTPLRGPILEAAAAAASTAAAGSGGSSGLPLFETLELPLEGISRPEEVSGLLEAAYGKGSGSGSFEGLAAGLRALRAEGRLCDARLLAGGQAFAIHQVILAAASAPLNDFITSTVADLNGSQPGPEVVEVELQGVTCGEALGIVLDHIYGSLEAYRPTSQAVHKEVFQMCTAFELPVLRGIAEKWRADVAQDVRPRAAATAPAPSPGGQLEPGAASPAMPPSRRPRHQAPVPAATPRQEPEEKAAAAESPAPSPMQEVPATNPRQAPPPPELKPADFERQIKAGLQTWRFDNWRDVPPMPPRNIAEAGLKRPEVKLLEHLRKTFEQRPVWLQGPLLERIFNLALNNFDMDKVMGLLPRVAYQWNDGPWGTAFTRLGYNPRENAEAIKFQVLEFRDPALKGVSKKDISSESAEYDHDFRRPPVLPKQFYQLVDIRDDYVAMLASTEAEEECSKKLGWLKDWVREEIFQRLTILSQELRERVADTPRPSKSCRGAASAGAGGGVGGRPQKRARVG